MTTASPPLLDARPIRPTAPDTIWDQASRRRDEIASMVHATLASAGTDALVYVSEPGIYPPWVTMEAWSPVGDPGSARGRSRAKLEAIVDVQPFNRTQLVTTVRLTRGRRTIAVERRPNLTQSDIADWTRCALTPRTMPATYRPLRDALMRLVGTLMPYLALGNPIDNAYRMGLAARLVQNWPLIVGIVLALGAFAIQQVVVGYLIVLATAGYGFWRARRIAHAIYVTDQPIDVPRKAVLVDSWHAVIAELGRDQKQIRDRLVASLSEEQKHAAGIVARSETYGYRTPNGFEERQRFILLKGQAIVYVHLYSFGNDMFVGWHAYLNWAQWSETKPVSRRTDRARATEYRELRNAAYLPNHLDIIDLNSLSELVHRRLEREIKAIMKEKAIDQEIDFKVIRGDRGSALDEKTHGADKGKRRGGMKYVESGA